MAASEDPIAAYRSMGKLARAIAHDLNNLLSAISGSAELLERQTETGHPLITEIKEASARASHLAQQVMQLSDHTHEGAAAEASSELNGGSESGARSGTLLVVIKQHSVRVLASQLLAARGHEVLVASGAETARQIGRSYQGTIDAALLDLDLITCSGPDFMAILAQSRGAIPAVYLAEPGVQPESSNGDTVLRAPVNANELMRALDRLLNDAVP